MRLKDNRDIWTKASVGGANPHRLHRFTCEQEQHEQCGINLIAILALFKVEDNQPLKTPEVDQVRYAGKSGSVTDLWSRP